MNNISIMIANLKKQINKFIHKVVYVKQETHNLFTLFQTDSCFNEGKVVEITMPKGLYYIPLKDDYGICFNISGNNENVVSIPYNETKFNDQVAGEVWIGRPEHNNKICFKNDGSITMHSEKPINIEAQQVNINSSSSINLGTGGKAIARVGDSIIGQVQIPSGSSAGIYNIMNGEISSGSSNNTSN